MTDRMPKVDTNNVLIPVENRKDGAVFSFDFVASQWYC